MIQLSNFTSHMRGISICSFIGGFAILGAQLYAAPVMLVAIILGLVMHFLAFIDELEAGIKWCAKPLLYIGVALLGLRIDLADLSQVGFTIPALTIAALILTIGGGYLIAQVLGQTKGFSFLIGGAVAICGVSAAAAISAAMKDDDKREQDLAITIAGITVISTLVMILYPVLARALGLSDVAAGVLMGGSIHNVSQAVGAGLAISENAGDIAVITKLLRVSMLLPIVFLIAIFVGRQNAAKQASFGQKFRAYFPPFLITFFILAVLSCLQLVPPAISHIGSELANIALVVSLVAIGIKTDLKQVITFGVKPLLAMTLTTGLMAAIIIVGIYIFGIA